MEDYLNKVVPADVFNSAKLNHKTDIETQDATQDVLRRAREQHKIFRSIPSPSEQKRLELRLKKLLNPDVVDIPVTAPIPNIPEEIERLLEKPTEDRTEAEKRTAVEFAERIIGRTNEILDFSVLQKGIDTGRAVGRIAWRNGEGGEATGFLIGHDLMMTNYHVFLVPEMTTQFQFELEYETGIATPLTCAFDASSFFYSDEKLDVAIVKIRVNDLDKDRLAAIKPIKLDKGLGKILKDDPVSIIHHPKGRKKSVTMHIGVMTHLADPEPDDPPETEYHSCKYSSDTEPGSSGSPVFSKNWNMVALHRKAIPKRIDGRVLNLRGRPIPGNIEDHKADIWWDSNLGTRVSYIVDSLSEITLEDNGFDNIRRSLIQYWNDPLA